MLHCCSVLSFVSFVTQKKKIFLFLFNNLIKFNNKFFFPEGNYNTRYWYEETLSPTTMGFYQKQSLIRSKQIFTNNFAYSTSSSSFIESESYAFKKYLCTDCGKSFSLKTSLKRHKEICKKKNSQQETTIGENNKMYVCDQCNRSYALFTSLYRHKRFECNKEPKFSCPVCHIKCKQKSNLDRHVRNRH